MELLVAAPLIKAVVMVPYMGSRSLNKDGMVVVMMLVRNSHENMKTRSDDVENCR
jgi:hypothetical protein